VKEAINFSREPLGLLRSPFFPQDAKNHFVCLNKFLSSNTKRDLRKKKGANGTIPGTKKHEQADKRINMRSVSANKAPKKAIAPLLFPRLVK
jgi:3'-phosphoadenosine 5'-phosphosulfate sulfotransferase (PAPS reductase)/FAD synthetase